MFLPISEKAVPAAFLLPFFAPWQLKVFLDFMGNIIYNIDMLEANGPALREPQSKALEPNLFELRTKVGSNISRVLYFFIVGKRIILANGFIKKQDQTPESEKARARRYRDDYFRRYGK